MKTFYYKISKMSDLVRRVGVLEADRKKVSSMWLVIQSYLLHNIFSYWNVFATDKKPSLSRGAVPLLWAGKNKDRNLWPDRRASSEGDHYSNYHGES